VSPQSARGRRRPAAPTTLDDLPAGLNADDRDWLLARAQRVGGLTEAFVWLVRLNILADAMLATGLELQCLDTHLRKVGCSPEAALDRAGDLLDQRLIAGLTDRLLHAATWTRPAPSLTRRLYDDPAEPLPHIYTRRLIREGRGAFGFINRFARAGRPCR
jgi:hypothetical protein